MTDVSLRDYIDTRIKSVEDKLDAQAVLSKLQTKSVEAKVDAQADFARLQAKLTAEAVKKAEESMNLRMEGTNEWRNQSKDREATYAQKEQLEALKITHDSRLKQLETSNAFSSGKLWMVMAVFASIPTILALIALFIR